jgi:3-dehydroquinate dehydratase
MSIFNQAEILHLQSSMSNVIDTQHQLVNILQEHETAIHEVQHDISKIRDGFLILINEAEETHAMVKIHDAEIRIVMAISTLRQTISCIGNGI